MDICLFAHGVKPGGQVGDSRLETVTDQGEAEHIYRKNQLIYTQFSGTNQVGEEYSVIEPQYSGEESGQSENQCAGENGFLVGHGNTCKRVRLNICIRLPD